MPPNIDHPESPEGSPIEQPFRWRDLWRVFLPLAPWIVIALVLSLLLSLWGYGRWPWYGLGALVVFVLLWQAVVIVRSDMLPAWQARLAPTGVAVARSCVDPGLIGAVEQAMSKVVAPTGMIVSSGYDALADAIMVTGVDEDTLVAAIGQDSEAGRAAAIQAIADGTLRVNPSAIPNTLSP